MEEITTFRNFLLLFWVIGLSGCDTTVSQKKSESNKTNDSEQYQGTIKLTNNKGVNFEYVLGQTTEFGENFIIDIQCVVTNETNMEIDYLNQTCSGLDHYLIIKPDSHKVMPFSNCNATWALISKLDPKDSLRFKTQILLFKNSDPIEKIGIDFRTIDKYIPFDILRENTELVENIYRSETQMDNVIWGNKK